MSIAAKLRKKAAEFEQLKQFDRAIVAFTRAIAESETRGEDVDVALLNKVGDLSMRQGRVADAVTYYERAIEHYASANLFSNAIALCNKVLRSAPGRSNVYFTLGRICARKGLRGDATRNFLEYAARMQQAGRVDESMRALAEVADLLPELIEIRRLVDEHAARAGITVPRRRTPVSTAALPATALRAGVNDRSPDLVFLDVEYESRAARFTPAIVTRIPTPSAARPAVPTPSTSHDWLDEILIFDPSTADAAAPVDRDAEHETAEHETAEKHAAEQQHAAEPDAANRTAESDAAGTHPPSPSAAHPVASIELVDDAPAGRVTRLDGLVTLTDYQNERVERPRGFTDNVAAIDDEGSPHAESILDSLLPSNDDTDERPVHISVGETPASAPAHVATHQQSAPPAPITGPPFRLDPHDFILPGELPPLLLDDAIVDAGLAAAMAVPRPTYATPSLPIASVVAEANAVAQTRRDALRHAVGETPRDWMLRRRLAEALFEAGERDAALAELEAAQAGFIDSDDIATAAEIADELVGVAGDRVPYHQKRVELAVRLHDQHRLRVAYLDLADTLVHTGDDGRARAVYARVLEIDPYDDRARSALGAAAPPPPVEQKVRPDDVFVDLAGWLRDDNEPASTRMRMREPTVSGDEQADFDALLRHFKEGVSRSLGEDDYASHYDLGVAYKEMGLLDDAVGEFQKALRSRTHRLPAYEALGQCFVEQERYQVAATVLSRALHEPGLTDELRIGVLYLLAFSSEALQRWTEAKSYYQRVYATDINFRDAAARLLALEQLGQ